MATVPVSKVREVDEEEEAALATTADPREKERGGEVRKEETAKIQDCHPPRKMVPGFEVVLHHLETREMVIATVMVMATATAMATAMAMVIMPLLLTATMPTRTTVTKMLARPMTRGRCWRRRPCRPR